MKRLLPRKIYSRCDLGVASGKELDCICCDRCRFETVAATEIKNVGYSPALRIIVVVMAVLLVTISTKTLIQKTWQSPVVSVATDPAAGEVREIDAEKIKNLIKQKKLSDKEAEFYKQSGREAK